MAAFPWSQQATRRMTSSPVELQACLERAFPGQVSAGPGWLAVTTTEAALRFDVAVGEPLRLGAFALPTLAVTVRPLAGSAEAVAALLLRVDRASQRGGG